MEQPDGRLHKPALISRFGIDFTEGLAKRGIYYDSLNRECEGKGEEHRYGRSGSCGSVAAYSRPPHLAHHICLYTSPSSHFGFRESLEENVIANVTQFKPRVPAAVFCLCLVCPSIRCVLVGIV